MRTPMKPYKGLVDNRCYMDLDKRFAIGFDKLQWILDYKGTKHYFPTLSMLFHGLFEYEVRESINLDFKSLSKSIQAVYKKIERITEDIKIPGKE